MMGGEMSFHYLSELLLLPLYKNNQTKQNKTNKQVATPF